MTGRNDVMRSVWVLMTLIFDASYNETGQEMSEAFLNQLYQAVYALLWQTRSVWYEEEHEKAMALPSENHS